MNPFRFFLFTISTLVFVTLSFSQGTISVSGTVLGSDGLPLAGANVFVQAKENIATQTDFDGKFQLLRVPINSILVINYIGYQAFTVELTDSQNVNIYLNLKEDSTSLDEVVTTASVSPENFWTGAKLGFNIIGNEDENLLVGSASLRLFNLLSRERNKLSLVGSVGSFSFKEKDIVNFDDQVKKLAQSINGLSLGVGYTFRIGSSYISEKEIIHRLFGITGARYNNYEDVGEEDITVDFLQWATTIGYEIQWEGFLNRGPLTLSLGTNLFVFNQDRYVEVFNEERGSLISVEGTLIIPFSPKVGLLANGTFEIENSPVYTLGLIFK